MVSPGAGVGLSPYLSVGLYEVCHVMIVMSVVISVYVIISFITHRVTQGYSCLRWCRTGILISTVPLEYFYEFLSLSLVSRVHLAGVGGKDGGEPRTVMVVQFIDVSLSD